MFQSQSNTGYVQYLFAALLLIATCNLASAEQINLNTADAETLQYIPGIGPSKAAKILELRQQTGGFQTFEELLAVSGIGEKMLLKLQQYGALESGVSELTEEMQQNPIQHNADAAVEPEGDAADG